MERTGRRTVLTGEGTGAVLRELVLGGRERTLKKLWSFLAGASGLLLLCVGVKQNAKKK